MNDTATAGPGSPMYAAPESAQPQYHTPKMDVFSFGVLLAEMCLCILPESQPEHRQNQIRCIQWPAMLSFVRSCIAEMPVDCPSMSDIMEHQIGYVYCR